jgi:hypothetical protein
MGNISAIETQYNGYKFRSRLEARHAYFFDLLGLKYEYEYQGYNVNGRWYLPDFYIPSLRCHFEIKPSEFFSDTENQSGEIYKLMVDFARGVSPIVCFFGDPTMIWDGLVFCEDETDGSYGDYLMRCGIGFCSKCHAVSIIVSDDDELLHLGGRILRNPDGSEWKLNCDVLHRDEFEPSVVMEASNRAKSERFSDWRLKDYPASRLV